MGTFAHKTELGGVRLGLGGADAAQTEHVARAARDLLQIAPAVLVEPMAAKPVAELIVGVAQDPVLGLHLVIGAGGVLTEILDDSEILLFPYNADDVRAALRRLRMWPLLEGYRGAEPGDVEAVVAAVMALADFVEAHEDRLIELDINPLFVHAQTGENAAGADAISVGCGGVSVVDALIRMTD